MRVAALALACAVLGGAATLAVGRATGFVGGSKSETVVARSATPASNSPPTVRPVAPPVGSGDFSPARIYAQRAPGIVTVFTYFGGAGAQGSGFVVDRTGTILTNAHVITNAGEVGPGEAVRPASSVYVEFGDGDRVRATIVGWDVYDDVGVIRVAPSSHPLTPVPLGRSAGVVVGEPVAAIGSPLGNVDSLAVGVVSAVGRSIAALTAPRFQLIDAIQTDAPIAHGSSGGPLLDADGAAIAINAQVRSDSGGPAGIGFAVPIDAAKRSLRELLAGRTVAYAYAGVETEDLTPALSRKLGLSELRGARITGVTAGGPAAKAGLRGGTHESEFQGEAIRIGGDVVVAVGGSRVNRADDLVRIVTNQLRAGQTVVFTVLRDGHRRAVAVRLAARPAAP